MEKESLNWFRFAKCLVTVGSEVLSKLLNFNIQTYCFSEYHELLLEKVSTHSRSNDLKILWNSFDQQYKALDPSCQYIFQSLLAKWNVNCCLTPMEIRQQLSFLKEWKDDVHDLISKHASQHDTLKKWYSEIQTLDQLNTSQLTLIKTFSQEYIALCQADQLDLAHLTERYHERTKKMSAAFLNELKCCSPQDPGELNTVLKRFQQEEINFDRELQTELRAFFISWHPKIDTLLDQWIILISSSPFQQILQNIVTNIKTLLPGKHTMCQTGLQAIYNTWIMKLRKMLSEWGNQLQQVGASIIDLQDLAKAWHNDLQAFPLASDQQIQDFFSLKKRELLRLKSSGIINDPQWSSLYPTHGCSDLYKFDITLLTTLYRNLFPICPPEFGWKGPMLETDHSTGADLMRLKMFRNDYFGHIPAPTLTTDEFENLWTTLEAILHRLSKALDKEFQENVNQKTAQLKICPFDSSEDITLKFEFLKQIQGDMLHLERSTYENVEKCLSHVQTIDENVHKLHQHEAFMAHIEPLKERMECMEQSMYRVEKGISKPIDILSRTEMLEGMDYLSERMGRIETRMAHIETFISNQKMNRTKLEKRIDQTRGRIERHKSDNSNVHVRTRALDHARSILLEHKHLVLQGKPGEGKTYLALTLVADLIEMEKEISPLEIHNADEWDEMVDTNRQLVVFMDDILGKYGVSETDLDRWKKISESTHSRLIRSSIYIIICIRTQIASFITLSLHRFESFCLFNSHVVDISAKTHCLTKEERKQLLVKYASKFIDRNEKFTFKDILEMENVIGFAQNCKIFSTSETLSEDLKQVFTNNMFLVEEIQSLSKKNPEIYTFLVLVMLSGGSLSLENIMNELNHKMKTISSSCGLKMLNIAEMKYIGHSLCGTFLEYNKTTKKFKFQHDCIETAVFVSFGNDYPDEAQEHCSLEQLCKMCCVANELDRFDGDDFLNFKIMIGDDLFRVMRERFNEGLESGERESFKTIAEALVWNNTRFVDQFSGTLTFADDVLNFLSKIDSDGQSLLIHLINAKSTLAIKSIIDRISKCCLRDHNLVDRQLLLATTNACLIEGKETLHDLIELQDKVEDFVMLAAASTGNVSIMEILLSRGGNINATISLKNRDDLASVIKNCIFYPKISSYHHSINLIHIACNYGLTDMVKYLMNSYPELVQRTSSLGRTAIHFLACSENVELMKVLSAEKDDITQPKEKTEINITMRDNNGANVLHLAAENDSQLMVKYLIENNRSMIIQNDTNGSTALHYAAQGGSVSVMETLVQAGLDINARNNHGANVLHIAALNDNLPIVKYLIENNRPIILTNDKNGCTALHYAAQGGSVSVIETLIQAGLDINARNNHGANVLHIAAGNDNLRIVKYLIENNRAIILTNEKNGCTALHYAAQRGSVFLMETLIQAGLDINARTNNGSNVLHISALNDNLPIVKYLIENNRAIILTNDKNGWTALHYAALRGSVSVMETLIQAGLDINARTNNGANIMHIAARNDNLPIVKYLIEKNLPIILTNEKTGWTALHYAAQRGSVSVIETLIQAGLDINARTNNGANIMHIAARNDNLLIVKYLIENNLPIILTNDKNGCTALHYASEGGSVSVMEILIQAGLDINARNNHGANVLHIAALNDNLPIVKFLIENNLGIILTNDKNEWTALHYAAQGGSVSVIETLIQAGLDINARTNNGANIMHIAARNDNLLIVKYLIENNLSIILTNDKNGCTALHYASEGGSVSVMETLIQAGLDINARNNHGANVLHIAAWKDNLPIVKYLIENNRAIILTNDKNGCTAMHYAAKGGSVSVIEPLIQAGLDINERTNNGSNVLHIAAQNGNLPFVKYLMENNLPLIMQKIKMD